MDADTYGSEQHGAFFKENKKIIFKVQKMETKIHDVHNKETTSV
jgi:hypothetical protein